MLSTTSVRRMRLWAETLLNTTEEQGSGYLRIPLIKSGGYAYCCLGIATLVADAGDGDERVPASFSVLTGVNENDLSGLRSSPADEVDEWFLGPINERPKASDGETMTLFNLPLKFEGRSGVICPWWANDALQASFAQIGEAVNRWVDEQESVVE